LPANSADDVNTAIKTLTGDKSIASSSLLPALKKYNEEQFATVKLPGGSQSVCYSPNFSYVLRAAGALLTDLTCQVIVSEHNRLDDGRYYDIESKSSWEFDHATQVCLHRYSSQPKRLSNSNVAILEGKRRSILRVRVET
jgi:capping protein alpha